MMPNAKRRSLSKGNGALPDLSIAYRYQGQIMICCSISRHFPSKQKSIVILLYYYDTIFAIYCKIFLLLLKIKHQQLLLLWRLLKIVRFEQAVLAGTSVEAACRPSVPFCLLMGGQYQAYTLEATVTLSQRYLPPAAVGAELQCVGIAVFYRAVAVIVQDIVYAFIIDIH